MNAPALAEEFLHSKLTANAELFEAVGNQVYPSLAPADAVFPYIVISQRSGRKTLAQGEDEWLQATLLYNVKVVTREGDTYTQADDLADLVFEALAGAEATIERGSRTFYVASLRQDEDIRYVNNDDGERSNHVGAVYMIVIDPVVN